MKIAIVVHFFPPKYLSGTEIATFNIAKYLAQKGHEVHVITWLDTGLPKNRMQDGFYVHRVFGKEIRFLSPFLFWISIIRCIKSIHPDIVHVQNINLGIPAFFSKKIFSYPYILYARGSEKTENLSFIGKYLLRSTFVNAEKIVVLTNEMKKDLQKISDKEIIVIPNGINLEQFIVLSKPNRETNSTKIVIFVGRILAIKGLEYLIEAMKIIREYDENICLILIGDGKDRQKLEDIVKNLKLEKTVIFKGAIQNIEIPKYLFQANIFVLPSLSEGFPNVILEAMAAGLPIVSTNVDGLSELIKNEENGYLVDPKNPDQLAQKILKILKNKELQNTMSHNNLIKAKEYSWDNVVDNLEKLYSNILITRYGRK
jgi:glycosyltransferase involved in cell wall biosynthesis